MCPYLSSSHMKAPILPDIEIIEDDPKHRLRPNLKEGDE